MSAIDKLNLTLSDIKSELQSRIIKTMAEGIEELSEMAGMDAHDPFMQDTTIGREGRMQHSPALAGGGKDPSIDPDMARPDDDDYMGQMGPRGNGMMSPADMADYAMSMSSSDHDDVGDVSHG